MNEYKIICDEKSGICSLISDNELGYLDNVLKEKINIYLFSNPLLEVSNQYYIELLKFYLNYSEYINFNLVIGKSVLNTCNIYNNTFIKTLELAGQKNETKVFQLLHFASYYKNFLNKDIKEKSVIKKILEEIGCKNKEMLNLSNLEKADNLITSDINFTKMFKIKTFPSIVMINEKNQGIKITENHNYKKYQEALNKLFINKTPLIPLKIPVFSELIEEALLLSQKEIEYLYEITIDDFALFIKSKLPEGNYDLLTHKNIHFVKLHKKN